jgi:hypothetical protein
MKKTNTIALFVNVVAIVGFTFMSFGTREVIDQEQPRPKKLSTLSFDVENDSLVVYSKRFVEIYFRQADIMKAIQLKKPSENEQAFLSAIRKTKRFEIVDAMFSYTAKEADSLCQEKHLTSTNLAQNQIIEDIGFKLIYESKSMIFSLADRKFITRGLRARKAKGILGNEWFVYTLPNGYQFYGVATALGE